MCTALENLKLEAYKEGYKIGLIDIAMKVLHSKGYSVSEISDIFDISEEDIMKTTENFGT